jgi:hypothetical protein
VVAGALWCLPCSSWRTELEKAEDGGEFEGAAAHRQDQGTERLLFLSCKRASETEMAQ